MPRIPRVLRRLRSGAQITPTLPTNIVVCFTFQNDCEILCPFTFILRKDRDEIWVSIVLFYCHPEYDFFSMLQIDVNIRPWVTGIVDSSFLRQVRSNQDYDFGYLSEEVIWIDNIVTGVALKDAVLTFVGVDKVESCWRIVSYECSLEPSLRFRDISTKEL